MYTLLKLCRPFGSQFACCSFPINYWQNGIIGAHPANCSDIVNWFPHGNYYIDQQQSFLEEIIYR